MPETELCRYPKFDTALHAAMSGNYDNNAFWEEDTDLGAWGSPRKGFWQIGRLHNAWQKFSAFRIDAATQPNTIEGEAAEVRKTIFRALISISAPYRGTLAKRLLELYDDSRQDDPGSTGIALDSVLAFFRFMQSCPNLKYPAITLTPENDIYASWRSGRNKLFSVHFLHKKDPRFVVFKPNRVHPDKITRISGTATADILAETVEPHGVLTWACDEG